MSTYKAPLDDLCFALYDVLGAEALFARLGQAEVNRELIDAVLDEAARFSETVLAPLNKVGDEIGCTYDKATGNVTAPPGFKQAFDQFVEGGWTGLTASPDFGGQGMPETTAPIAMLVPEEHEQRRLLPKVEKALPGKVIGVMDSGGRASAAGVHGEVLVVLGKQHGYGSRRFRHAVALQQRQAQP